MPYGKYKRKQTTYRRKKGGTSNGRAKWSKKGGLIPPGHYEYATRKPYNDDPNTPFPHYPTGTNRNEFYCKQSISVQLVEADTATARSFFINYPTYFVGTGGIAQASTRSGNFGDLIAIFDEYTVNCMRVEWLPYFTDYIPLSASAPDAITTYLPTVYSVYDLYDATLITTSSSAFAANAKALNMSKPFKRTFFPQNKSWIQVSSHAPNTSNLTQQTVKTPFSQESAKFYFPGIINNKSMGTFVVHWFVRFRGLTPEVPT